MNLSDAGLEFIAGFEGYLDEQADGSCKPYRCQAGVLTLGYGCTEGITEDMRWTKQEALQHFRKELVKHEAAVNKAIKVPVTQNAYDALVSFSYNCGTASMGRVAAVLSTDGQKAAAAKLLEYCKFRSPKTKQLEVSRGLLRRRAAEVGTFAFAGHDVELRLGDTAKTGGGRHDNLDARGVGAGRPA